MIIRVIDFETTGLPPDAAVCEVGWSDLDTEDINRGAHHCWSMLVNPGRPIPVEARAVHHISDADVSGAIPPTEAFGNIRIGADIFCAHNAKFEQAFFDGGDIPWICTLKVARRLWPDCPNHSNQCLRYYLGLELDWRQATPTHRAGPDAFVTSHILFKAIEHSTVDEMIEWTKHPSLLPRCLFWKHKGKGWHEIDDSYLEWIVRQKDMDEDVVFTAKHHLNTRVF